MGQTEKKILPSHHEFSVAHSLLLSIENTVPSTLRPHTPVTTIK